MQEIRDSLIPGSGRSSGEGDGNPLQYSCLENPLDRGAWCAMVHGVMKSWIQLKWLSMHTVPYFKCWIATCDYPIGQHKYRTFSPLQKSLLDTAVIAQRWTMNQSCTALCHLSYCCDKWWNFALLVPSLLPKALYYVLLAFLCMLDKSVLCTVQEVSKYLPPFPTSEGVVWHFVSAGVLLCSYWAFLPTDSLAL